MTNQLKRSGIRFLSVGNAPDLQQTIHKVLAGSGFSGEACTDPYQALNKLSKNDFNVLLSDLNLSGMDSLSFLEEVRRNFPDIALVVVTDSEDTDLALRAARAGASDYLVRPLRADALIFRLHRAATVRRMERELERHRLHLEETILRRIEQLQEGLERIERTWEETLRVLGHALGLRDNETELHCQRVTRYCRELAYVLHCSFDEIKAITRGAYLHDIGKIGIPDAILHKPGPLTAEERTIMEKHVRTGYEMVRRISFLAASAEIVLTHHERLDGSGYPQGLSGDRVPLGARIFAVADTLDAITSRRPYRAAQSFSAARDEIVLQSGRQFDPKVVQAFLSIPLARWQEIRDEVDRQSPTPEAPDDSCA